MDSNFLRQYCDRYGEPLAQAFSEDQANLLPRPYQFILCVPAYDEPPDFIDSLLRSIHADVLVLLIFNAPMGAQFRSQQQQTQQALRALTATSKALSLIHWNDRVDVLTIDCCTDGRQLPLKAGVGLARKISGDIAVAAIAHGKIMSPWIYCTDADVRLPDHYFEAIPIDDIEGCAAALYPFIHEPPHDNILQYEISLRYYVLQLEQMRSPYAFQTVGSSMAVHAQSYAAVRGFPKRNAAEDFYILNKLAKTGAMIRLETEPLVLSSRRSHRVPFGTGAAMNKLYEDPVQLVYHPEIFGHLGQWFEQIDRLWEQRDRLQAMGLEAWWAQAPLDCDRVLPILIEQGLPTVLNNAFRQCRDRPHFRFYMHVWFDAFRTLRFIHLMRDRGFPSIPISELYRAAPSLNLQSVSLASLNDQLKTQEWGLRAQIGPTQCLSWPTPSA